MKSLALLLHDQPIVVSPTLAKIFGINHAIVLQQLHFLLGITEKARNKYNFVEDKWWVYNSYEKWRTDHFPWLSERTIQRILIELETKYQIVRTMQSVKHPSDREKWYTIDYEQFDKAIEEHLTWNIGNSPNPGMVPNWHDGSRQTGTMVVPNWHDDSTETTSETTTPKDNAGRSQSERPALDFGRVKAPNRGASVTDRDISENKKRISPTDPEFPPVGRLLIPILARNNVKTRNLTLNQAADLTDPVVIPGALETQPSPQDEYTAHPQQFRAFVDQIEDMPWLKKNGITAGNLIKAVRGYHFYKGWYTFHPDAQKRNEAETRADEQQQSPMNGLPQDIQDLFD